jgi:O-antigen/teichoic acid export membrane protein
LGLVLIINCIGLVPFLLMQKELDFRKRAITIMFSSFLGMLTSVVLAILGYGVWSIVYGQIVIACVNTISYYIVVPWRPRWLFDRETTKSIFDYTKHLVLSGLGVFACEKGDTFTISKFLGATQMGLYTVAYELANLPASVITSFIEMVLFPAFSKLRDHEEMLKASIKTCLKYIAVITIPAGLGIMVLAEEITTVVYGTKWLPMVAALRILCLFGIFRSFSWFFGDLMKATGRTKQLSFTTVSRLFILLIIVVPFTIIFNIVGTAWTILIALAVAGFYLFFQVSNSTKIPFRTLLSVILKPTLAALIMSGVLFTMKLYVNLFSWYMLILGIAAGVFVFLIALIVLDRQLLQESKELFSELIGADIK